MIRRDRRVVLPEELSDAELELIANVEVSADYAYLDAELTDATLVPQTPTVIAGR